MFGKYYLDTLILSIVISMLAFPVYNSRFENLW